MYIIVNLMYIIVHETVLNFSTMQPSQVGTNIQNNEIKQHQPNDEFFHKKIFKLEKL